MHFGVQQSDASRAHVPLALDFIPNYPDISRLLLQAQAALERNPAVAMDCIVQASALLRIPPAGRTADGDKTVPSRGGLAPWQSRRVRSYIADHLAAPILLQDLAALTRLSVSYFSRAFKISFGEPPHAYIVWQRIERAKHLMLTTDEPLARIALDCGLADQSHLTRLFRTRVGMSPQSWRREQGAALLLEV